MAEKKESYSEEELNEMIVWFNNHADELPKEMQINKSAFTPDLTRKMIIPFNRAEKWLSVIYQSQWPG